MDLRAQLQQDLGSTFALERELTGGGMSRVFVAQELRLGRTVVVKVLSPDLAQGLNAERFEREIKLAASLQQANIVPVLMAGDVSGIPWFTMPYVEGESLRVRLARGALGIGEVVAILRDVARALAYAHARGVVHRDIKPDNILLSGGTAVVTDFGIAKAISASRTEGTGATLTQMGTSIGTPAYMAPEQVAGDPDVDSRADLYSFGCMAYELLTGRQPFGDRPTQKMLAAHLTEAAPDPGLMRLDCPPALGTLVRQLMAKSPDERPASAAELMPVLESAITASGPTLAFSHPGMFKKALGFYVAALVGVAVVARAAVIAIGLPDWVFPGAILVMALGLPVILITAYVQRVARHVATATPTLTPGGTSTIRAPSGTMATIALKASPHMTWRRTTRGGMIAVGGFAVLVAGFMLLRALGIGPWGSLLAAGKLSEHDHILVSDFSVAPGDSALGPILVEAVRAALSQSSSVRLVEPAAVAEALQQMRRSRDEQLDPTLAREVATRVDAPAILGGRVAKVGDGYAVSLDLTTTQSGATLASFQGTADGPRDLLDVVDNLARKLRGRMGESLRNVQRSVPLERATTASLPALRKYSEAVKANDVDGDYPRAVRAAREAVALDSTFGLAWRKLSVALKNAQGSPAAIDSALRNAVKYSDRLPDRERYLAQGAYYENTRDAADRGKAIAAYRAAYNADSSSTVATHELFRNYGFRREWDSALRYVTREAEISRDPRVELVRAAVLSFAGHADSARALRERVLAEHPDLSSGPVNMQTGVAVYEASRMPDSVRAIATRMSESSNLTARVFGLQQLVEMASMHGKLTEATSLNARMQHELVSSGAIPAIDGLSDAIVDIRFVGKPARGAARLDSIVSGAQWQAADPKDRPYTQVATLFAVAGRPDRARAVLDEYRRLDAGGFNAPDNQSDIAGVQAEIALAQGRHDDAVQLFHKADLGPDGAPMPCEACTDFNLARTFDAAGNRDSALAYYRDYLDVPPQRRSGIDWMALAATQKRLGELYDSKGDRANAVSHYGDFVDLWKDADPELQPVVATVRKRLGELTSQHD